MFTIQQIQEAHSKVKSGADFLKYMQDIIALSTTPFSDFCVPIKKRLTFANRLN